MVRRPGSAPHKAPDAIYSWQKYMRLLIELCMSLEFKKRTIQNKYERRLHIPN